MRARAFLMLEMIIVMMIMMIGMNLLIYQFNPPDFNDYIFMSEYLKMKSMAMAKNQTLIYNNDIVDHDYPIIIDKNGTINQAQTILSHMHRIKINLGSGYLVYER